MAYKCANCKLRAKYDQKPTSLLGRFWRWHINFCPGWKAYFTSLSVENSRNSARSINSPNINTNEIRKTFFQPVLIFLALWSTNGWEYCKGLFKKKEESAN